jgi:hypothetical protein
MKQSNLIARIHCSKDSVAPDIMTEIYCAVAGKKFPSHCTSLIGINQKPFIFISSIFFHAMQKKVPELLHFGCFMSVVRSLKVSFPAVRLLALM